ncbi:hypothetical protein [Staphylococcus marylandisciuri]|uniref:hypothetical protein n=1 Tax=Staphylococcus marylandisciuri TaxID=2981529 RepID=UPI0021D15294|nr:hypothetical protein [Staphylococcus marylandisciuri]
MGPQHRETGNSVSTSTASWGGRRNLFIQIRFLSRSRIVSVSVDNPAFGTPLIGFPEHKSFMSQTHAFKRLETKWQFNKLLENAYYHLCNLVILL